MFDAYQKPTGTAHPTTAALLIVAFVFSPAALLASHPFGYLALSLAVACSMLCLTLAWVNWRRFSRPSIPVVVSPGKKTK